MSAGRATIGSEPPPIEATDDLPISSCEAPTTTGPPEVISVAISGRDFDAFYRSEHRRIVAIVLSLTGDRGVAEDVTQEAFATALRKWETICTYERPGEWVRHVAVNKAISRFRKRTNEAAAVTRLGNLAGPPATGEASLANVALWDAVRRLPKRQRQVVALVYVDDRSLDDVARILGCSTGAVKSHLHRARQTLASQLDRGEVNP